MKCWERDSLKTEEIKKQKGPALDVRVLEVRTLHRIGEKKAGYLMNLGIRTVYDLLCHYPFRYEDRRGNLSMSDAVPGEKGCICGEVLTFENRSVKRKISLTRIMIREGERIAEIVLFNNPYILSKLRIGQRLWVYGMIEEEHGRLKMTSPEIDFDETGQKTGRIYPIYPLTRGILNEEIIRWQKEALLMLRNFEAEYLPEDYRRRHRLCGLREALENIHFPSSGSALKIARYRLVFDEFFLLYIGLSFMKTQIRKEKGIPFDKKAETLKLKDSLPFRLTGAQERVLQEILEDMSSQKPMQRLLQGDVGSGKTVIALLALHKAYENGFQSVLMAPTEILAKQHFESAGLLLKESGIRIRLLTGSTGKKEKESIYRELAEGNCDLLIGTHAVLEEKVKFRSLGLVVTDEQHRFGVRQRARLLKQSFGIPDMLVMTATPIPRTMAFLLHGDLDLSVIDQLPEGRKPILTKKITKGRSERIYDFLSEEIGKGRQVYIVCPLIEESETLDIRAAEELYEQLRTGRLSDFRIALMHGRMKGRDKQEIMRAFAEHQYDILISTTVIEVGVNVPNASVMVIQDAQRFGLSQLHQLRGRVGRGEYQSHCILVYDSKGSNTKERMKIMCESNDGFFISEKDLELRGPGEFLGTRQHGLPSFKLADPIRHQEISKLSSDFAKEILSADEFLEEQSHQPIREEIEKRFYRGNEVRIN